MIVLACFMALVQARPQEIASPDEVELIPAVQNEGEVDEGGPVVVVIRGGLPQLPGLGGFFNNVPGFSGFPFQPQNPQIPNIFGKDGGFGGFGGLDGVFGDVDSEESDLDGDEPVCGPLCQMFRVIQGLQGEIDDIHTQMNGPNFFNGGNNSFFDGNFDINNSTYEEKELDDGTKVKINRTVLADTDENGNQFFFHSSVLHNFDGTNDDGQDVVDLLPNIDDNANESDVEIISEIPESDPAINEINDEVRSEEFPSASGVDEGLQQ